MEKPAARAGDRAMSAFTKYVQRVAVRQWEIACACICIIAAVVFMHFAYPFAKKTCRESGGLVKTMLLINKADSLSRLAILAAQKADMLDSLVKASEGQKAFSDESLPGTIYELAAKSGIKASKVEIAGRNILSEGIEIPVRFMGEGEYSAAGKFIEGVEGMEPAARIKELSLKNAGKSGNVSMFLQFSVLSGNK
jgi:hypothetical protein